MDILIVFALGILDAIIITIHELFCPHDHSMREKAKRILKKVDLIQTSFNCDDDQIFVQQFLGTIITQLPILTC